MFALVLAMMLSIIVPAYAAVFEYPMTYLPGTTDTVTNLPAPDAGTGGEPYTVSSQIPQRQGYEFLYWTLDYGVGYKVTYVVNPDKTYGTPEGSTVPTDPTRYKPGDYVDVKPQLTTTVDYAYNEKGEKVKGIWEFVTWDKDDFPIYEDTTITGGWVFTPAPVTKYHYIVQYCLWDGKSIGKKVHADKSVEIDSLGIWRREDALPIDQLNKPYSVKKNGKYQYRIVTPYQEKLISYDGFKITILYEKIPQGQVVNPNTVLLTYAVYGDPIYGLPDDVTVPDKKAYTKNKDTVTITEALCTAQNYAMLNGEKVPGTWTFTGWDKTGDFVIDANTTITGSWIFTPAEEPEPEESASCTVRCLLKDGTPLAPEIKYTGRRAGMQIRAEAKPIEGYSLTSAEVITITLEPGDNVITFCYEKIVEEKASFTMRYLLQDGTPIAEEKTVTGRPVGEEMRAKAKTITGYRLISDEVITITLQEGDNNIFTFYYEKIAEQEPVKEETPDDAAKDAPKDATEDAAEGGSEGAAEGGSEGAAEGGSECTAEVVPAAAAEGAPGTKPEAAQVSPPESVPETAPLNTEVQTNQEDPIE